MNIIKSQNYKESNTTYWSVHHVGGLGINDYVSTRFLTADTINKAHKERWNFQDSLTGYFGGYSFYIDYWGNLTQFRALGSETAAQRGFNFNGLVISICFAGNFNKLNGKMIDMPSAEQIAAFRRLAQQLPRVKFQNIKPHWFFNQTACYGTGLSEGWARGLVPELDERGNLQILLNRIQQQIFEIMRLIQSLKLGGSLPKCEDSARG